MQVRRTGTMTGTSSKAATRAPDDKLRLEQLELALRNLKPHPYLMPLFGLVVCVIFSRWIPLRVVSVWLVALTLSHIPLAIVAQRFSQRTRMPSEVGKWVALVTGSY